MLIAQKDNKISDEQNKVYENDPGNIKINQGAKSRSGIVVDFLVVNSQIFT